MSDVKIWRIAILSSALMAALSGCSRTYVIEARVEGGRLVFHYVRRAWLGAWSVCVNNLTISTDDKAVNAAPMGSGLYGYERRIWAIQTLPAYWNKCFADFPIAFGSVPRDAIETVKRHGLKPGVVYRLWSDGPGSSGRGAFRLTTNMQVENLSPS